VEIEPIVYAGWLYNHLIRLDQTTGRGDGLQVIQVGDKDADAYRRGHIPGAIYLDTNTFECAPAWNVLPDAQLEQALLPHGIHSEKRIVLYGRDRLAVARTALVLTYAGVCELRIFWGGIEAWRASEAFLYARWLGWKDICIYDGGWLEWSAQADNPIEVGEPG
jgi:3-mercaptopyruvate sulfurtransferase SseA